MTIKSREIGVGVLGYGMMGIAHSHGYQAVSMLYKAPVVPKLVAICGRTEDKVLQAANRLGYKRFYRDWGALIKDPEVEVVDNTLPPNYHYEPSIEAIENGKHIICEKPLARSYEEALEMYRAAERSGVVHATAFNYRWLPAVIKAKKMIEEGYIGKPMQFHGTYLQDYALDPSDPLTWRFRREEAGYGALGDLGSHILDLARFLMGETKRVCAISRTFTQERPLPSESTDKGKVDVDDISVALLDFENGAVGCIETSWSCSGRKNSLCFEVHGSEGAISFDLERLNELHVYDHEENSDNRGFKRIIVSGDVHPYYSFCWPLGELLGTGDLYTIEIAAFLESASKNRHFVPSFYDGLMSCAIMDSIVKSAQNGKWVEVRHQ